MPPRVSAFTRWHSGVVESRKTSSDYAPLDRFRQEVLSQEKLYEDSVRPFVNRCLQGCSGSIITYGAWGSGKSYTLGTLDPQQLVLATPDNDSPGVLPRCIQQLYDLLGNDSSVEVTCLEVQGDDVLDLLDTRGGAVHFSRSTATDSSSSSSAMGYSSPVAALSSPQGTFSRSPIVVAAAAASRRRPLTSVVVRSLTEALSTLKRAVSNRQTFSTATRQSSSRTHAVFQLRWRNPSGSAVDGGETSGASGGTPAIPGRGTGVTAAQRAFSAPPRSSLVMVPQGCPAGDVQGPAAGNCGPVCTLTLVDTCTFCPLLPAKEASAVKRSLLALSRVLSALQRRQALTLRESKLTRMLEGAVEQVLLLSCLGGTGDDSTVQLVKMLQQGVPRDGALRRSRRASSSDSRQASGAWESASSLCAVGTVNITGGSGSHPPPPCAGSAARAVMKGPMKPASMATSGQAKCASPVWGFGASRTLFHSPPSPPATGHRSKISVVGRTEPSQAGNMFASGHDSADTLNEKGADLNRFKPTGGCGSSSGGGSTGGEARHSSGGGATDTEAIALPPISDSSLDASLSSPTASRQNIEEGYGHGSLATSSTGLHQAPEGTKANRTAPPSIHVMSTDMQPGSLDGANVHDGGGTPTAEMRSPLSSGGRRPGSSIPSPPGCLRLSRKLSPQVLSKRQKPASVTARAAPGPEVRRSQGFSVLMGKWAAPQPLQQRDTIVPVVPCMLQSRESPGSIAAVASPVRSSVSHSVTRASTEFRTAPVDSERRLSVVAGSNLRYRSSPGPAPSHPDSDILLETEAVAATQQKVSSPHPATLATHSVLVGSAFAMVSVDPESIAVPTRPALSPPHSAPADATASMPVAVGQAVAAAAVSAGGSSPAPAMPTSARRKPNLTTRNPARTPQRAAHSPHAAAAADAAAPAAGPPSRPIQRPPARSPSPIGGATFISLAAVPPTRLASMRYGSANASQDSVPEDIAAAASAAPAVTSVLLSDAAADAPPSAQLRMSLRRQQPDAATVAGKPPVPVSLGGAIATGFRSREAGAAADPRRSVSTGLRWPSPLLRARREVWLSDMRRSRSAQSRRVIQVSEPPAGGEASPRQRLHGFRCAAAARPTLSTQYKDLMVDFKAFKARERTPRHRRTSVGAATPTAEPPTSTTEATGNPDHNRAAESTIAAAGAGIPAHGSTALTVHVQIGSGVPGSVCFSAPVESPPMSTGVGTGSPASVSTPHSSRAASVSCARPPPPAYSRAHSPRADEGLLSLTAAAAAAAASPRTPHHGNALPSGRPRPGVSRIVCTSASPRPPRSPERPSTPISPTTVLDMSRLFVSKGSPTAGAAPSQPPPCSGRSHLSIGSMTTAGLPGQHTSGGSERYRRLEEEDADSMRTSESEAELDADQSQSEGASNRSGGSESDRDNILGPSFLGNLGLMLDAGGNPTLLRQSISRSGLTSPSGVSTSRVTPSSVRRTAANAAAEAPSSSARRAGAKAVTAPRASGSLPSEGESEAFDEELPAVSFFIHRFTPRAETPVVRQHGAVSAADRPATAARASPSGPGQCPGMEGKRTVAALRKAEATTPMRPGVGSSPGSSQPGTDPTHRSRQSIEADLQVQESQLEPDLEMESEARAHRVQRLLLLGAQGATRTPGAVAAAAAAAVAELAELQRSYIARERVSAESGVLRGSCTASAGDLRPQADAEEEEQEQTELEQQVGRATLPRHAEKARSPGLLTGAVSKNVLGPPSHSSISLRQLLEQQQQLLQQRPGRRAAGWFAAAAAAAAAELSAYDDPKGPAQRRDHPGLASPPLAANRLLAQRAHVQPNHMDLDEHSTVLVDIDSASESDILAAMDITRGQFSLGQLNSRPSPGAGGASAAATPEARGASPLRPGFPLKDPHSMLRVASPLKVSPSHSPQLPPPMSVSPTSIRTRVVAVEAQSPVANTAVPHTPQRMMTSWTPEDSGDGTSQHPSATAASGVTAAQGASAGDVCHALAQARSVPFAGLITPVDAIFEILNNKKSLGAASGAVIQHALACNGMVHPGHTSAESGANEGAGASLMLQGGTLGCCPTAAAAATAAAATAIRTPAAPQVQVTGSTEEDASAQRPSPVHVSSPPTNLVPPQQALRGSGNVAAAWRAAAAMSTSSSSVRSCFRSSSGQQQHSMLGSDATAVATVVAVNRAVPVCNVGEDKHSLATATPGSAALVPASAAKLSTTAEHIPSLIITTAATGSATTAVTNAANPCSPPPLPPRSSPRGPYVPPLALALPSTGEAGPIPNPKPPTATAAAAAAGPGPPLTKTKSSQSARADRILSPIAARLRACKSYRTPRATAATAISTVDEAAEPQPTPPPAYPPGFISWAAKLFSGSRKNKHKQ